jgi:hypothetical protein
VTDSWSHTAVCRQRHKPWPTVGYMMLCVDRELTATDVCLHKAVCRRRPELWSRVGYIMLCLDRDLKCGQRLVT